MQDDNRDLALGCHQPKQRGRHVPALLLGAAMCAAVLLLAAGSLPSAAQQPFRFFLPFGSLEGGSTNPTPTPTSVPVTGNWSSAKSPAGVVLFSVTAAPNGTWWTSGTGGTILTSTDDGATWSNVNSGTGADLYAIRFPSAQVGVAVGTGGTIRRSTDGGATWQGVTSGTGSDFGALSFADSMIGWATAGGGTIMKTTDGGATWTPQAAPFNSDINGVYAVDANNVWAVGNAGAILHTSDSGANWSRQPDRTASLTGVFFFDTSTGLVSGDPTPPTSNMWRTSDGGATWTRVNVPIFGPAIQAIKFINGSRGWAAVEERVVLGSSDGGQTWTTEVDQLKTPGEHTWLYGIDAKSNGLAVAVGGVYPDNGSFTPLQAIIMRRS